MKTPKPPRVPEKVVQQHIRALLRSIGAVPYTIGRPPRRDATFKGTGQTAGIPDLYVCMPANDAVPAHGLWVEVKATGGRLRPEQEVFRDFCHAAEIPHIVGGLDEVRAYLRQRGYIREDPGQYRRPA